MSVYDTVVANLPLTVRAVDVQDPVLTFIGQEWSLTLVCPWALEGPGLSSSWESEKLQDDVWTLVGDEIIDISAGPDFTDPTFHFSSGGALSVRADTDLDPWTLMLPDVVVIGQMRRRWGGGRCMFG